MKNNVEGKIAGLRRALKRAIARCERADAEYRAAFEGKIYLCPDSACDPPISVADVDTEHKFISNKVFRGDRFDLYYKVEENGFGYAKFRTISERTWQKILRLENKILDAWEVYAEAHWALTDALLAQPQLFHPLPSTPYDDAPRVYPYTDEQLLA